MYAKTHDPRTSLDRARQVDTPTGSHPGFPTPHQSSSVVHSSTRPSTFATCNSAYRMAPICLWEPAPPPSRERFRGTRAVGGDALVREYRCSHPHRPLGDGAWRDAAALAALADEPRHNAGPFSGPPWREAREASRARRRGAAFPPRVRSAARQTAATTRPPAACAS